jgi:hypothetical protein
MNSLSVHNFEIHFRVEMNRGKREAYAGWSK